ncbi:MAG: shikimate dehydrogenase [Nitrospirae bacterium]|nr:shikimate dehydrogenase [Nitrospirota bacterium]MBI3594725.1 shikimate dehydrogenase [Nitrospirota bacterium]
MKGENTTYLAIIGHPVSHSLSPQMHEAAFKKLNLNYRYLSFEISPLNLKNGIQALKNLGFRGFNVTLPFKEKIMPFLDQISPEAKMIGAVNTVLIENGKLKGFNTDGAGFLASLKKKWNFSAKARTAVILGAGGAARAVAIQLCLEKIKVIGIANRTAENGMKLKKTLNRYFPGIKVVSLSLHDPELKKLILNSDLLVNTTSVGLFPGEPSPIPSHYFHAKLKVCDLIYNPPSTAFLKAARKRRCSVINGAGMLLFQGALAFQIWTGKRAPLRAMSGVLSIRSSFLK